MTEWKIISNSSFKPLGSELYSIIFNSIHLYSLRVLYRAQGLNTARASIMATGARKNSLLGRGGRNFTALKLFPVLPHQRTNKLQFLKAQLNPCELLLRKGPDSWQRFAPSQLWLVALASLALWRRQYFLYHCQRVDIISGNIWIPYVGKCDWQNQVKN